MELILKKEEFAQIIRNIEEQDEKMRAFDEALGQVCDGYPVFDVNNKYLESLLFLLDKVFGAGVACRNMVEWYLYDSDEERMMYYGGYEANLNTPELLFEYLESEYRFNHLNEANAVREFFENNGEKKDCNK